MITWTSNEYKKKQFLSFFVLLMPCACVMDDDDETRAAQYHFHSLNYLWCYSLGVAWEHRGFPDIVQAQI